MSKKLNKDNFSAYRLFYDEFIYKENMMLNYDKIKHYTNSIKELTIEIRNSYRGDFETYNEKLNSINMKIKQNLNNIKTIEPKTFTLYYYMYKNKLTESNDTLEDMPFIISTSFYNDYRIDDKENGNLDLNKILPRFSSLEKKEIKKYYRENGLIELFIHLLENREENNITTIKAIKNTYSIKPIANEEHYTYNVRIEQELKILKRVIDRCENKSRNSSSYEIINDALSLVLKKPVTSWSDEIISHLQKYFQEIYQEDKLQEYHFENIKANKISYEAYKKIVDNLYLEKEKYTKEYKNKGHITFKAEVNDYGYPYRKKLIPQYFDERLVYQIIDSNNSKEIANCLFNLTTLSNELINNVFEYDIFCSATSLELKRNNDVESAVTKKIYEIYNPYDLLQPYEKKRCELFSIIDNKNEEFKIAINNELKNLLAQNNYQEKIKSLKQINDELIKLRKNFVGNHVSDIKSQDETNTYDTRNYDLSILCQLIPDKELKDAFQLARINLNDRNPSPSKINNLIEFFTLEIYKQKVKNKDEIISKENKETILKDIAHIYLDEEYKPKKNKPTTTKINLKAQFEITREIYKHNSCFVKLNTKINQKK